jgi:Lipocalin-like domain
MPTHNTKIKSSRMKLKLFRGRLERPIEHLLRNSLAHLIPSVSRIKRDAMKLLLPWLIFTLAIFSWMPEQMAEAQFPKDEATAKSLIGTWRLVSRVTTTQSGKRVVDQLGEHPVGYLIYDNSGHVFAQLMRPNRSEQEMENCGGRRSRGENNPALICGYDAYFGTYKLLGTQVVHHLEGALAPEDIGKEIHRSFAVEGDRLTITFSTTATNGEKATRTITWERVK